MIKAWVFAHIQLTPEEAASYENVPVVYDGEYGFFFEPNEYVIASHSTCKGWTEHAKDPPTGTESLRSVMNSRDFLALNRIDHSAPPLPSSSPFLDHTPNIPQILIQMRRKRAFEKQSAGSCHNSRIGNFSTEPCAGAQTLLMPIFWSASTHGGRTSSSPQEIAGT